MKIDWKQKLTSRKLWVAVAGFVTGTVLLFTAGWTPYGGFSVSDRVTGKATEFAFDIITIDRNSGEVNRTRVGHGADEAIPLAVLQE